MRILLSCLMCLLLTTAQMYAVKGGPVYPAGTNVTGTYGGVLEPRFDPTDPFSANSLGIFTMGVPSSGLATGTFVMFAQGIVFKGTIQGLGDPNKGTVRGILDASFTITTGQITTTDIFGIPRTTAATSVAARASGNMNAHVEGTATGLSTSATLLKGTANIFISESEDTTSSPTPTATPTATPGSGGGSGSGGGISAAFTLDVNGFKQSTAVAGASVLGSGGDDSGQ